MNFLGVFFLVVGYFTTLFVVAQIKNNNSIVDIGWGPGFVLITIYYYLFETPQPVSNIVSLGIVLWGIRLFLYISIRNWRKPEDYRYVALRQQWGKEHQYMKAYVGVFMVQALFMILIAAPVYAAYTNTKSIYSLWLIIGSVLFVIGFMFESIGDYQLRRFSKQPENKGRIMQSGLWKYTRHPNYFGEMVTWWSLWIMVATTNFGLFAIISPLTITCLLLYVSGVPLLEKKYRDNIEFQKYAKKTSKVIPWFSRK